MIDPQTFRSTLSHWASGVTVVTTQLNEQRVGITASSFSSLSLEPPQILICVAKKLYTHQLIEQSRIFAVNILGVEQLEWGMRFAGMIPEIEDRFQGIDVQRAVTGAPILTNALAWLDCILRDSHDSGDHTIFIGEVMATQATAQGNPLLYYQRNWRQLDSTIPTVG